MAGSEKLGLLSAVLARCYRGWTGIVTTLQCSPISKDGRVVVMMTLQAVSCVQSKVQFGLQSSRQPGQHSSPPVVTAVMHNFCIWRNGADNSEAMCNQKFWC
jgi:hypothetical protein